MRIAAPLHSGVTRGDDAGDRAVMIYPTEPSDEPCIDPVEGAARYDHPPNRTAERALALAASSSRSFGAAVVSSEASKRSEILAMSSTAE